MNGESAAAEMRLLDEHGRIGHELSLDLTRGHAATVEKVVTMFTSRDDAASDPGDEAGTWVMRADLLRYHGAEIIVEVARLFASLATFDRRASDTTSAACWDPTSTTMRIPAARRRGWTTTPTPT